jgi:hypothetical protein
MPTNRKKLRDLVLELVPPALSHPLILTGEQASAL